MDILLATMGVIALIVEYYIWKHKRRLSQTKKILWSRWLFYGLVVFLFFNHPVPLFVLPAILVVSIINIREDLKSRNVFSAIDFLATALVIASTGPSSLRNALAGIGVALVVNGVAYWSDVIGEGDLWSGVFVGAVLGADASYVFWWVVALLVAIICLVRKELPLAIVLYPLAVVFVLARLAGA